MKKMRMRNWMATPFILLVTVIIAASCTDVDLCYEGQHPHIAGINLLYEWPDAVKKDTLPRPDSMLVIACRVVNNWRCCFVSTSLDKNNTGRYLYNDPDTLVGDSLGSLTDTLAHANATFLVRSGEYVLATASYFDERSAFTLVDMDSFEHNSAVSYKDLYAVYKPCALTDSRLNRYSKGWIDRNPYSHYIADSHTPIFYDSEKIISLWDNKTREVVMHPKKISQNILFKFDIKKQNVYIDSVIAEISGICERMNLYTRQINSNKTYKAMFTPQEETSTLSVANALAHFSGEISVTGLVAGKGTDLTTGAGILQLAIHTYIFDAAGIKRTKTLHAGINLYNTITKWGKVIWGKDETVVLDISQILTIDKDQIQKAIDEGTGLDHWIIYDEDIHTDI